MVANIVEIDSFENLSGEIKKIKWRWMDEKKQRNWLQKMLNLNLLQIDWGPMQTLFRFLSGYYIGDFANVN